MKTYLKDIKSWFIIWFTFLITVLIWTVVYAAVLPTVTSTDTLTAERWNNVINEVNQNTTSINNIYNSSNWNLIWSYIRCNKFSPVKGKDYDCNWNEIWSNWIWDFVSISCPNWSKVFWWWCVSSTMRQNNPHETIQRWQCAWPNNIDLINAICAKME